MHRQIKVWETPEFNLLLGLLFKNAMILEETVLSSACICFWCYVWILSGSEEKETFYNWESWKQPNSIYFFRFDDFYITLK